MTISSYPRVFRHRRRWRDGLPLHTTGRLPLAPVSLRGATGRICVLRGSFFFQVLQTRVKAEQEPRALVGTVRRPSSLQRLFHGQSGTPSRARPSHPHSALPAKCHQAHFISGGCRAATNVAVCSGDRPNLQPHEAQLLTWQRLPNIQSESHATRAFAASVGLASPRGSRQQCETSERCARRGATDV